jgi:dTDP-4-dehydrorhamnose reductase
MNVLVVGSSGQLATHLREFLPEATYLGRPSLDLTEPSQITEKIRAMRPRAVVNAAAYTGVDKAESEPKLAWLVNAESVAAIARAAASLEIPFVHVSSDYVFDGRKTTEYLENDATGPLSVYGATKLAGEIATRVLCSRAWILRTSWLFSEHGTNFVTVMLRLAATRESLGVVADQRGRPTYGRDLAKLIGTLVSQPGMEAQLPFGTYHATGGEIVSRKELAERIIEGAFRRGMIAKRAPVHAISEVEYATAARRPANAVLQPSAELKRVLGTEMDWRPGLDCVLDQLRAGTG